MFKRMKEEERIEKIIRGLLRLPDNKRCINCNSLGPQYICTNFWTFVCTRCSGVHREFTHRVKSVSMARFSEEEVSALESGGNERAKEIYFKTWDPYRNSYPDSSNLHRLRDFIKHVYVDRKYTGERGHDKLPSVKTSIKDDYKEMSTAGAGDADRSSFENFSPRKRSDDLNIRSYSMEERRSPRNYNQAGKRSNRERSLPTRFEIVDDRFRDEGSGDVKRYQYHIFSKSESRRRSRSPVSLNAEEVSSPPRIRSINEILGDKVIALKVGESPKSSGKVSESSAEDEKMAKEKAAANLGSLIDLETDPQPQQTQQTDPPKETSNTSTPPSSADKVSSVNLLESLFLDMSTPVVASTETPAATEATSVATVVSSGFGPTVASPESTLALPEPNDSTNGQQTPSITNQHSAVPMGINSSNVQQSTASFDVLYGQQNTGKPTGNTEAPTANQANSVTAPSTSSANDPKSIGRKELPADLFTSSYPPAVPGWQFRPPGMMYGTQYHPAAMSIPALPNSAKSRNPFDIGQDGQVQAPEFPSMLSVQAALPNLSAPISVQPQQLPYAFALPPQTANYGMTFSGEAYAGQQIPNNMALAAQQGNTSIGKDDAAFASLNPLQQSNGTNPTHATSNSFSSGGGNPFG
ncbi:probable ADP-ribosylation factor GTPase-activating protein AGD14 isoform X1 [Nicotiana sylvestris]|uniref:Probable ADP-ribosylation factor GTPase-activating protein AGD14 n=2 Tax=Nicotiana sylvestris TaxID=4096 RepID=A0A1U7V8G6_NICSY|nr:PREDICTED: probable ADP-ribosylation factor GTPase-activating protein AGD14 [Nicotiana sylvestris]XP_009762678.1 PREDICTED: probable ADP-ribosylation factor GTPase-activating protein AGD14 [Nicotiana sylvestris]